MLGGKTGAFAWRTLLRNKWGTLARNGGVLSSEYLPNAVVKKNDDKTIFIEGVLRSAFTQSVDGSKINYDTPYSLTVYIQDEELKNIYQHKSIVVQGKHSFKTIKEIVEIPAIKIQYEENVQRMMNSLYMYIITH